jgi:hypothetical protein
LRTTRLCTVQRADTANLVKKYFEVNFPPAVSCRAQLTCELTAPGAAPQVVPAQSPAIYLLVRPLRRPTAAIRPEKGRVKNVHRSTALVAATRFRPKSVIGSAQSSSVSDAFSHRCFNHTITKIRQNKFNPDGKRLSQQLTCRAHRKATRYTAHPTIRAHAQHTTL